MNGTPKKAPLAYQLEKLADWDKRNRAELAEIREVIARAKASGRVPPLGERTGVALRLRRLEKSVKQAQRYCDEIGHVRPPRETHENGDGQ